MTSQRKIDEIIRRNSKQIMSDIQPDADQRDNVPLGLAYNLSDDTFAQILIHWVNRFRRHGKTSLAALVDGIWGAYLYAPTNESFTEEASSGPTSELA